MVDLFYFWGCVIPARLPFVEKSIRLVMERLGKRIEDLGGFTCCPERALVKAMGDEMWLLTAARNLANAERYSREPVLVTPCNGCAGTLKLVRGEHNNAPQKVAEINEQLAKVGLRYEGRVRVKHMVEFLHQDVGLSQLKGLVQKPLVGMRLGVHPGCHFSRPNTPEMFDEAFYPRKLDELMRALGAETPDYPTRELCCGQEMARVEAMEESLEMLRTKLRDFAEEKMDAIVVCCPACYQQFDQRQFIIQRQGEAFNIPVFYFSELMALSFGILPQELFLAEHRIGVEGFLKKWESKLAEYEKAREIIDLELVRACYECGACLNDCPAVLTESGLDPQKTMCWLLEGKLEEALEDGGFWLCLQCHTCAELCPQNFAMEYLFEALRQEAMRRGLIPKTLKMGVELFNKKAVLAEVQRVQRQKFGLPELPESGSSELFKLLKRTPIK